MSNSHRRDFLKDAAVGLAAAAAKTTVAATTQAAGANERVVAGIIGPGGMGTNHLKNLAANKDVRVAYVCDPDADRLASAAKLVESLSGTAPQAVKDMRQVFDD